ncbi:DUF1127 domain-containing protein [Lentibacter algarum]|uniref:DUF1127 domain-containing protein n=1 Tax=Lentibacter algarum TaxID=576131 RepID=UPI003F5415B3
MNYVFASTSGALEAAISSAAGKAVAMFSNAIEAAKLRSDYRKTVAELSELSNADLADLGMSRSGIHAVAYKAVYGI